MADKLKDIIIDRNKTLLECYRMLNDTGERILACVDNGKFIGIVTDSDLRRGIVSGVKLEDKVSRVINKHPVTATSGMTQHAILALMREKSVDPIPVVDGKGNFIYLYSMSELLKSLTLPNSAVVMAGGFGKRLMPLTKDVPKPLLKVDGKPIIEHVINHMADYGIESFYVTVNYKSEAVKDCLRDGKRLGVKITYLEERKQLGTIGAISLLKAHEVKFPFIVINGDILTRVNFKKFIEAHTGSECPLTVCLATYHYDVPYGVVDARGDRILGMSEKPQYDFFINAGIYCMNPELIDFVPKDTYYDINMFIQMLLKKKIPIGAFDINEYWRDIGNFEDFYNAKSEFREHQKSLKEK